MLETPSSIMSPILPPVRQPPKIFLIDFEGIAMIWLRDMSRLWRQRSRLYNALARALVWLFALGFGLRRSFVPIAGLSYEQFVFPGVVTMTIIFSALQSAISIVYDREFGFLKEVQVAPTPRSTLVLGKCLGCATSSTIQAAIVLVFAPFASVALTPLHILNAFIAMFITALAISSLGVAIGMWIDDFENFGSIQNFITLPLYLFSGAVFPTRGLPTWLNTILLFNPLAYGVSAIRGALLDYDATKMPLDLIVLGIFTLVMLAIAIYKAQQQV